MLRAQGGVLTLLSGEPPWLYVDAARWTGDRLISLRATMRVENGFVPMADRLEILRGTPASLPSLPDGFAPIAMAAFESGAIFVAGRGSSGADDVLYAAPGTSELKPQTLPGGTMKFSAMAGRDDHAVYVGGGSQGRAYLAAWNGAKWTEAASNLSDPIVSLSVARDGTLFVVTSTYPRKLGGSLWRQKPGGSFDELAMPALEDLRFASPPPRLSYEHEGVVVDPRVRLLDPLTAHDILMSSARAPLYPQQVVARSSADVWVVASREDPREDTFLLHTQEEVVDVVDASVQGDLATCGEEKKRPNDLGVTSCTRTFASFGEAAPDGIARVRRALAAASLRRAGELVVGSWRRARVFGIYFGGRRKDATALADEARARGISVVLLCGRPALEGLVAP
jgi:hypothetical protein